MNQTTAHQTTGYDSGRYSFILQGEFANLSFARLDIHNAASKRASPGSPLNARLASPRHECNGSSRQLWAAKGITRVLLVNLPKSSQHRTLSLSEEIFPVRFRGSISKRAQNLYQSMFARQLTSREAPAQKA